MNKKIIYMIMAALFVVAASAALLTAFGTITLNASVDQAVLVDGGDNSQINEDDLNVVAGAMECYTHTLENQAEVPVGIELVSSDIEGIAVSYEKTYSTWTKDETDFSKQDYLFDMTVTNNPDGSLTITIVDADNLAASYPAGTISVFDADGNAMYMIGYNTERTGLIDTVYKEYSGSWGSAQEAPVEFTMSRDSDSFTVVIPDARIAEDDKLAFNVERIGYSSAVNARYPTNWGWQGFFPDAVERVESENMASSFMMTPSQYLEFNICYLFAVNIQGGDYTVVTDVNYDEVGSV